ncbi:MAG: chemotaxis protein CheA [Pseudomonadota bacterium]
MEEEDDFKSLFFTECDELLADLQEHLDTLADGGGSAETVNAAFRAVHSVKGGAAAFGFNDLISFAHAFETVMDRCRSGDLELSADVSALLLRASDVMETLVENARSGVTTEDPTRDKVLGELAALSGGAVDHAAPTVEEQPCDPEPADNRTVTVTLAPGPDFFTSGNDPLKIIRSARDIGLTDVAIAGEPQDLAELDLNVCPYRWTLTLDTEAAASRIEEFFDFYRLSAEIEIDDPLAASTPSVEAPAPIAKPTAPPKPAAPLQATPTAEATPAKGVAKSLRVEIPRIDRLVNLVGEIVITQAALAQNVVELNGTGSQALATTIEAMSRQTRELQESVMAIRAQPVKSVFSRMPRVVRDLSDKLEKKARLVLSGEHTEVDATVIEELAEPLTHMLRNSMDHGLETPEERLATGKTEVGTITLSAEHRGERVVITLTDDGRGIDRDRVRRKAEENGLITEDDPLTPEDVDMLIFHPGFSTAQEVSSVSGRGVGMDVVKRKIQSLGGRCSLINQPGQGTQFQITLPLTLAVLDGMTICVGDDRFILPLSSVVEALRVDDCTIEALPDQSQVLARRGEYIRLMSLRTALDVPRGAEPEQMAIVVDTETNGHVALLVDELLGQRQVVLKSLEANFQPVPGVSGATILGDGRVALILDVPALVDLDRGPVPQALENVH